MNFLYPTFLISQNRDKMTRTETFLSLYLEDIILRDKVEGMLNAEAGVYDVLLIGQGHHLDVNFCFEAGEIALHPTIARVEQAGVDIKSKTVHLPADISGIRSVYDVAGRGSDVKQALESIEGVEEAGISSSGVSKLSLSCKTIDEDSIIRQAIAAIKECTNNQ